MPPLVVGSILPPPRENSNSRLVGVVTQGIGDIVTVEAMRALVSAVEALGRHELGRRVATSGDLMGLLSALWMLSSSHAHSRCSHTFKGITVGNNQGMFDGLR